MKIAILSTNRSLYSTKRLVEAANKRGHECQVIDHSKCYVGIQQAKPSIHYKGQDITEIDAIIPRIGSSVTFYGSAIVRQFEVMGVISANPSQAITRSRDKLRCMQILSGAGLGLPITGFARTASDVDDLINMVGGAPLVIKLLEGTQGIGVVLAETKRRPPLLRHSMGWATIYLSKNILKKPKARTFAHSLSMERWLAQ